MAQAKRTERTELIGKPNIGKLTRNIGGLSAEQQITLLNDLSTDVAIGTITAEQRLKDMEKIIGPSPVENPDLR